MIYTQHGKTCNGSYAAANSIDYIWQFTGIRLIGYFLWFSLRFSPFTPSLWLLLLYMYHAFHDLRSWRCAWQPWKQQEVGTLSRVTSKIIMQMYHTNMWQVLQNDLKCPKKVKCFPYMLLISLIPKYRSISLYGEPFLSYRSLRDKCTKLPRRTLTTTILMAPHICPTDIPQAQSSVRFAQRQLFWAYRPIWDKCIE